MKKIMYCAALLTALTFTSCTKDEPNVTRTGNSDSK